MSKISADIRNGRFVIGRRSGAAFNAVEGLRETPRIAELRQKSDAAGETGEARRQRIRRALTQKAPA